MGYRTLDDAMSWPDYEAAQALMDTALNAHSSSHLFIDTNIIVNAALGDKVLYEHDGESRLSDDNHMTARECEVHAIEWGMIQVLPKGNSE